MTYSPRGWRLLLGDQTGQVGCLGAAGTTRRENVGDKRQLSGRQAELSTT